MINFKIIIEDLGKGKIKNEVSNLIHYIGAWDGKWDCDPASTAMMWIE